LENRKILAVERIFEELLQDVKNKYEEEIISDYWKYLPKKRYKDIMDMFNNPVGY
jgi:hypothetical protein